MDLKNQVRKIQNNQYVLNFCINNAVFPDKTKAKTIMAGRKRAADRARTQDWKNAGCLPFSIFVPAFQSDEPYLQLLLTAASDLRTKRSLLPEIQTHFGKILPLT